jgi:hypothetical protein
VRQVTAGRWTAAVLARAALLGLRRLGLRRLGLARLRPGLAGLAVLGLGLAGCSSGPAAGATGTSCGATRTGVDVPVVIAVARGPVNCAVALRVEAAYAAAVRAGDLRGNGGGAPVKVDGWTCQSYPTPEALRSGDTSECHTASAEVVAVLSLAATSSASSSSGSAAS